MQQPLPTKISHLHHQAYWKGYGDKTSYTKTDVFTCKAVLACSLLDAWKESKNNTIVIDSLSSSVRTRSERLNDKLYSRTGADGDFIVHYNIYQPALGAVNHNQKVYFYSENVNWMISAFLDKYYGIPTLIHCTAQYEQSDEGPIPYHQVECELDTLQKAMATKVPLCTTLLSNVFAKATQYKECSILKLSSQEYPDVLFALFASGIAAPHESNFYDAKDSGSLYCICLSPESMQTFKQYCETQCKTEFKIQPVQSFQSLQH